MEKKKVKTKAKQSAKQAIARTRKKVAKAEQTLRSAKIHAKNVKDKLLTIDKVLDGKEQQLITQDVIDEVPANVSRKPAIYPRPRQISPRWRRKSPGAT